MAILEAPKVNVAGLVLNNVPTNVTIVDSNIELDQANFLINSKQSVDEPSIIQVLNCTISNVRGGSFNGNYPAIYIEGYSSVIISSCIFIDLIDTRGLATIMIAHSYLSEMQNASV